MLHKGQNKLTNEDIHTFTSRLATEDNHIKPGMQARCQYRV